MNKTGTRVYNINSQGSFCSSELLLSASEQSYRRIGQSPPNRVDIRLSLIRPHQRDAHSPAPLITAAGDRAGCSGSPNRITDLVVLIWLRATRWLRVIRRRWRNSRQPCLCSRLDFNKSPAREEGARGVGGGGRAAKGKERARSSEINSTQWRIRVRECNMLP